MAKKMPLYLSTLTVLIGSLLAPSVKALGEEENLGPWSFDELFAANIELDIEVAKQCNDPFRLGPCTHNVMESKGSLYEVGLQKFRYNQLHVRSFNFKTSELEYYLSSKDYYREECLWNPSTDFLRRLVILQVEEGYDGDYFSDIKNGVTNQHLRILYSDTKGYGETSLLPVDQLAVLQIEKPLLNSGYDNNIKLYYEDTNNDSGMYTIEFNGALIEDQKYYVNIDGPNPYPYIKDFSYETGLNEGYDNGYQDGYDDGSNEGYTDGYTDGYEDGSNNGKAQGYDNGYENGFNQGLAEGFDDGYWSGHSDGFDEGLNNGYTEGYDDGRMGSYVDGYTNGYADGYNRGRTDEHDNNDNNHNNTGSDASDTGDSSVEPDVIDTDSSGIATINDRTISSSDNINSLTIGSTTNNSIINLGSKLSKDVTTPKAFPRTPNTGTAEYEKIEQGNKVNFPWWLGVIFGLNALILTWFLWPSSTTSKKLKNRTKKS